MRNVKPICLRPLTAGSRWALKWPRCSSCNTNPRTIRTTTHRPSNVRLPILSFILPSLVAPPETARRREWSEWSARAWDGYWPGFEFCGRDRASIADVWVSIAVAESPSQQRLARSQPRLVRSRLRLVQSRLRSVRRWCYCGVRNAIGLFAAVFQSFGGVFGSIAAGIDAWAECFGRSQRDCRGVIRNLQKCGRTASLTR